MLSLHTGTCVTIGTPAAICHGCVITRALIIIHGKLNSNDGLHCALIDVINIPLPV